MSLTATSSGKVYQSYPILPFGFVACTLFPTTFLKIAVFEIIQSVEAFMSRHPSGREKGVCTVILLRLHPASLTHKNPTRRAIIYGMRAIGRKERSIDLKVFW